MDLNSLGRKLDYIRFMSIIAVVASCFGSLLMFFIGAVKVIRAYGKFFLTDPVSGTAPLAGADASIAFLVQALDAFLIAVGLMIFGGGIYNLFVQPLGEGESDSHKLFNISSISELKSILAELVIIILMVKFLEGALLSLGRYQWEILILPLGVLMLAIAARVLKLKE